MVTMIAFGVLIGLTFPLFTRFVLGTERALSWPFFLMCITAGFVVGLVNFLLFKMVVSKELARVALGMKRVLTEVETATNHQGVMEEACELAVTSNDAIGDIEVSFNDMTGAIVRHLEFGATVTLFNANLAASVELEDVADLILGTLAAVAGARAGLLYADQNGTFSLLTNLGIDQTQDLPPVIDESLGAASQAISRQEIVELSSVSADLALFEHSTPLGKFRPASILLVPLIAEQRTMGLLVLACETKRLSPEKQTLFKFLGTQAASHLQNAILHRRVKDLAALDDLTRILNRRFGMKRLGEVFQQSIRHGVPVSIMMIDVDHFKQFNDTYGHAAGDAVLKSVAVTLENALRAGDVVCRYGGEEFMVVAPGVGLADSKTLAERLRRAIEVREVTWEVLRLRVTVSIGVATWPLAQVDSPEDLIAVADKQLYAAKAAGRNQVSMVRYDRPQSTLDSLGEPA